MTKPTYRHPEFVLNTADHRTETKRYWLKLTIDNSKADNIIVILKNPSRATKDVSDKTVFNVTNYIEKNSGTYKCLNNIGTITIVNLIPLYETYSDKLAYLTTSVFDDENLKTIDGLTSQNKNVIIAWGNHPSGLYKEYEKIKASVLDILSKNKNDVYFVHKMTNNGNPKHGQVWGYADELINYKLGATGNH